MIAWLRLLNVLNKICIHLFIINCLNVLSIKMISNEYFTYHPRENSETQISFCRTLTYDIVVISKDSICGPSTLFSLPTLGDSFLLQWTEWIREWHETRCFVLEKKLGLFFRGFGLVPYCPNDIYAFGSIHTRRIIQNQTTTMYYDEPTSTR